MVEYSLARFGKLQVMHKIAGCPKKHEKKITYKMVNSTI
jgi:hypothetical protein